MCSARFRARTEAIPGKRSAPDEYRRFRDALGKTDYVRNLAEIKVAEHGYEYDEVLDEAVADEAGRMVTDGKVLDEFIERNRNDRTLLEKVRDAIRTLWEKLTGAEKRQAQTALGKLNAALDAGAKRAQEIERSGANKNAATEGGETRYSRKKEVLALKDVDWMADNSSIKQQLQKHDDEITSMEPVAVVDYTDKSAPRLVSLIMDEVKKVGGARMKRGEITFEFDEGGARKIVSHARANELRAASLAAPYVAKRGKLIAGHRNHEGGGTSTLTYAAPVVLNGRTANVGVVIQFTNDGRPHAVNVGLQGENGVFNLDMKKAPKGLDSRVTRYEQGTALPTMGASEDRISDTSPEVKTRNSLKSDADYLSAVKRGDMETAQRMVDEAARAAGYDYVRHTRRKLNPRNGDAGYFLFVEADKEDSLGSVYGDHRYFATTKASLNVSDLIPALKDAWKEYAEYNDILNQTPSDTEFDPDDIVMSAGVWDDWDFVSWLFTNYFFDDYTSNDVPAIKTSDGLIVFGEDSGQIKSADPVTYDENGEVIPLSKRFDTEQKDIRYSLKRNFSSVKAATRQESLSMDATDDRNMARYQAEITAVLNGSMKSNQLVLIGVPSQILRRYLKSNQPLYMPQIAVKKAALSKEEGGKHGLGRVVVDEIPYQFADPLAITGNTTEHKQKNDNSIVVWTDWKTENGDSVIVPIRINANGSVGVYNNVNTVFDAWDQEYVADLLRKGNVLYTKNGKSIEELLAQRRDMPKWKPDDALSENSVSEMAPEVKLKFSLKSDSDGRELSDGQQEYFENSRAVDNEGRLLTLYHGTTAYGEITTFKRGKSGDQKGGYQAAIEKRRGHRKNQQQRRGCGARKRYKYGRHYRARRRKVRTRQKIQ